MEQTRYFYKSIPLIDYCKNKYLDYSVIIRYINDKTKLVNGVTKQDLLDSLLSMYELYEELLYGDELLSLYVVKNHRKYHSVLDKIVEITNGNPNEATDTVIDNVLFRYGLSKTKYFYKGEALEVVAEKKNLSISKLESDIKSQRRNFPKKDVQSIVNKVVETAIKNKKKYYYKGVPLKTWCETHYIDYGQIVHDANHINTNPSGNKEEFYNNMLSEIEKYEELTYENMLFITYCIQNKIVYYTAIKNFIRLKKEYPDKLDDEVIKLALEAIKNHHKMYKLEGKKKKEEVKEEKKTTKKEENKNVEKEEIMKYKYKGFDLKRVCYSLTLNRSKFVKSINEILSKDPNTNIDYLISSLIYQKLQSNHEVYVVPGENKLLLDYCLENNIDYREVIHYINTNKTPGLDDYSKVYQALRKYDQRRSDTNLYKVFNYLKYWKNININDLKQSCDITDIDFKTLLENRSNHIFRSYDENDELIPEKDKIGEELTDYNILMLTWYFYDRRTEASNKKYLSHKKLTTLLNLFEEIEKNRDNKHIVASKVSLFILIALYKSGLYRSTDLIYIKASDYLDSIVAESWDNKWLITKTLVFERFMDSVNSCPYSDETEMLTYIDTHVRSRFGLPDNWANPKRYRLVPKKDDKKKDKKEDK